MKKCVVCHDSKDESEFLVIAAGEVDQPHSKAANLQFENLKWLSICKECWHKIPVI
jgi:hypothetical protein